MGWQCQSLALASINLATPVILVTNKIYYSDIICLKTQIYNAVVLTHLFRSMFIVGAHQICGFMLLFPVTWK